MTHPVVRHYVEPGPSRVWLLIMPALTLAMIVAQGVVADRWSDWWLWVLLGGLCQLFVWMQVTAGRTHVSVELTDAQLRCGAESIPLPDIAEVLPGDAPDHRAKSDKKGKRDADDDELPAWLSARVMGRLRAVPRRRFGLGLRLTDGSVVQAWARNDYALREALEPLVRR